MFALRRIFNNARQLAPIVKFSSNQSPLVDLTVDNDGVAIMTLQRPPVNTLNLELLKEMSKALDDVAKNRSKGMILASSLPMVFSAGLDMLEIYKPDLKRAEEFWTTLQDVWLKLFGSGFATAAAINGHAPAGGCLLSMSCEYRVMVKGKFTIGLNESTIGLVAPKWFMDTMCQTISVRQAEYALTTARMFTVDEALKVGLIDEISADETDTIAKCKAFIKKIEKMPAQPRALTKQRIRGDAIRNLQNNRQADIQEFLKNVKNPQLQQNVEIYIQALKKKGPEFV